MYFLNSPIEPETSIIAMTTAFDSYRITSSHVLNLRSSFLMSPKRAFPSRALRRMFSRIMRRLSRFAITPVRRISLNFVLRDCTAFFAFSWRYGSWRSSKIGARVLSGLSGPLALTGPRLAYDDVADARLAVALSDVFALLIVEAKLVFVECFDRNFDGALAVGEDDSFVRDDRAEVLADGFLYTILVALLIDDAFAL